MHYCVRIRAEGDTSTAGGRIYGDYTFLNDAFSYVVPSLGGGSAGAPGPGDYLTPAGRRPDEADADVHLAPNRRVQSRTG